VTSPPPCRRTRGATLVEALAALGIAALLLAATQRLIVLATRQDAELRRRLTARRAAVAVAAVLRAELELLDAAAGDLVAATESTVVLRAVRGAGYACGVRPGAIIVADSLWSPVRAADPARDSVLVWLEGDPPWTPAGGWVAAALSGVGGAACDDGSPGLRLDVAGADPRLGAAAALAPVRTFEIVEYRAYPDAARTWWLGIRTRAGATWAATSPVAGPLAPRGLTLRLLDAGGAAVVAPGSAVAVELEIRGMIGRYVDSLRTVIAMRPPR